MARMGIRTGRTTALTRRVCATDSETDMPIAPSSTGDDTAVTPPIWPDTTGDTVRSAVTGDGVDWHIDRKSTRLNSSHVSISYAVFCLKKKKEYTNQQSHS